MATSGNFSTTNQYIVYWIEVIQNSQNIGNNTSNVTVKIWIKRTNTGYETYGNGTVYTNINGVQRNVSMTPSQKITSSPITIFHQDLTIPHNNDGTKTLNVQVSISHDRFNSSPTNVSWNCNLSTIPRASSFTMSSNNVNAGSSVTINISKASSSFTHEAHLIFGKKTVSIRNISGTSVNFTIPKDILDQIPNATKGAGTMRISTISGGSNIGNKDSTIYVNAPNDIVPSYSSLSIERIDNVVPSSWGVYVKGKSKAKLTINGATGIYNSTISKYSISGDGYSSTTQSFTTNVLRSSGTVTFTGTITDSRGRVASKTVSCSVVDYSPPTITEFDVVRCTSNGTDNDEGTYVKVTPKFTYSLVNNKNTLTCKLYYRKIGVTSWTEETASISSGSSVIIGNNSISPNSSYEVKLTIADTFETIEKIISIPTAKTTLDFRNGGNGLAIGKVSESDGLEVDWESFYNKFVTIRDGLSIEKDLSVSSNANINGVLEIGGTYINIGKNGDNSSCIEFFDSTNKKKGWVGKGDKGSNTISVSSEDGDVILKAKDEIYLKSSIGTYKMGGRGGEFWNMLPVIRPDGVMEIGRFIDFHDASGATTDYDIRLTCSGSTLNCSGSFTQGSDIKLKENIHYLDDKETKHFSTDIDEIEVESDTKFRDFFKDTFRPCTFNYKNAKENLVGFIAQDIADTEVGSLFVREMKTDIIEKKSDDDEDRIVGEESYLTFDLSGYTTVVAKALQEEIAIRDKEIEKLQNRVGQLEELIKGVLVNK